MKTFRHVTWAPLLLASLLAGCGSDETETTQTGATTATTTTSEPDVDPYLSAPTSCAYHCPPSAETCSEVDEPYACPAMGPWAEIPHLEACPEWDGTYPEATQGSCTATEPTGDALARPGPDGKGGFVLPDGRTSRPAGSEWVFAEPDVLGGITVALVAVPGTPYVLTVDTGNHDHAVRAVDTSKIGVSDPVTSLVKLPSGLNRGIVFVPPGRVYVATAYGVVQALAFDTATGALTVDDAASLALPASPDPNGGDDSWYVADLATSPDGKRLLVAPVEESTVLVYDVDPASATYAQKLGEVDAGRNQIFAVAFDPNDATGSRAWVSAWGAREVIELDVAAAAAPAVVRTFPTDKNPQGLAFLDARWMAVANDLGETISLIDRVTGDVTSIAVELEPGLYGLDVSGLSYDASSARLYATLAGINAIAAYDVDLSASPPTLTPAGRLTTGWWPSGMVVGPDGSLTVTTLRGRGIGAYLESLAIGDGDGDTQMRGSIQQIPAPTAADLEAGDALVAETIAVADKSGYPAVDCPGSEMDFPVPPTNTEGPSPVITHVFFIVRENKTFDSIFGDMPGLDGDPALAMKASSKDMDRVWTNLRELAREFTVSDNFYNLAVKSTQGHTWTTHGRATDFDERTWADDARMVPLSGVGEVGRTVEGSLFEWLQGNGVAYDILGEIVGNPKEGPEDYAPADLKYPGGPFQNIDYNDLEKACYTASRLRVACNIRSFVYKTLPNDHTVGASPDNPSPEVMCAVNDEATGMFVDALSHSPLWASSLVVITEDDPQQGGDHVDYQRTPLVFVSPWVKRGYVSKTHVDTPSLLKIFAHVFGLPYPNLTVKNAPLPFDVFTSTPDYSPYTYAHRSWPLECGKDATRAEQELTDSWDFAKVDEQPGLGAQVMRWMRGRQLTELSPRLRAEIEARKARRARGETIPDAD